MKSNSVESKERKIARGEEERRREKQHGHAVWCSRAFKKFHTPSSCDSNSVLATRSLAFELTFQSLSSKMMNPVAQCVAFLRSEGVDPALRPNRCLTMGSKKVSPANCVSKG